MQVTFNIPDIPSSLNVILRMHFSERKRMQDYWDMMVHKVWLDHDQLIFEKPVKITYVITFLSQRARDYDNYLGGTKFINDSLRRSFLLKDDSQWLRKIDVEFKRGETWNTEVTIEEVE